MFIWPLFFCYLVSFQANAAWPFSSRRIVKNIAIPHEIPVDYKDQLKSFKNIFISTLNKKIFRPNKVVNRYLKGIVKRIIENNEILLPESKEVEIFFIKDEAPYIFSLPDYKIFISSSLIKKYIKNESVFIGALAYEVIKSGRNLYKKNLYVPKGYVDVPSLIKIVNIEGEIKTNLFKWTFLALKRSGHDGGAVLNWIQTINRNSLQFSWHLVGRKNLSLEEFQFKTFLVSQGVSFGEIERPNSSRGFYRLKRWID